MRTTGLLGPRVRQTSNAYVLSFPKGLGGLAVNVFGSVRNDLSGLAALSICKSLLLALMDCRVLSDDEFPASS